MFNLNSKNTREVENSVRRGKLLTVLMVYMLNQNKGRMKKIFKCYSSLLKMALAQPGALLRRVLEMTDRIILARQASRQLQRNPTNFPGTKYSYSVYTLPEHNTNSKTLTRKESQKEKPKTMLSNE